MDKPTTATTDELLTIQQVAERLQVSETTVKKLYNSGVLPHKRISKRIVRFRASWIDAYLSEPSDPAAC
ncbi:MAG TPA: helix-turn-helix domain-containing protein [Bellilinea sp.]|nr:helix-turn-helix domain-containing protein [Bellilinea sp.]